MWYELPLIYLIPCDTIVWSILLIIYIIYADNALYCTYFLKTCIIYCWRTIWYAKGSLERATPRVAPGLAPTNIILGAPPCCSSGNVVLLAHHWCASGNMVVLANGLCASSTLYPWRTNCAPAIICHHRRLYVGAQLVRQQYQILSKKNAPAVSFFLLVRVIYFVLHNIFPNIEIISFLIWIDLSLAWKRVCNCNHG
jgi:hypothetical protein